MPSLADRSPWMTGFAFTLAVAALVTTALYLRPLELAWPNLLVAFLVIGSPLVGRPPLSMQRLLICAAIWVVVGVPGAYFFGTPIFYAGCLLSVVVALRLLVTRAQATAKR